METMIVVEKLGFPSVAYENLKKKSEWSNRNLEVHIIRQTL